MAIKVKEDDLFQANIMWIDEANFFLNGVYNRPNNHWANENHHETSCNFHDRRKFNVYCAFTRLPLKRK